MSRNILRAGRIRFGVLAATVALTSVLTAGCSSDSTPAASTVTTTSAVQTAPAISRSTPTAFTISSIGASGSLISLGLNADGTVQVPADYRQAGWYQQGPAPGEQGSAVILGHVDSYQGEGIFFALKKVKPGDLIDVTRADGKIAHFKVTDVRMYQKSEFPDQLVYGSRGGATLQVVTCGGQFDQNAKSYLSNVVVFSSLDSVT
ncbi:class F sortase [Nocardia yamanashiensis]|uniref:class F sortase n=1 Tax=Nocardia yamanashiensis TaxID=209247 RepID=UPI001E3E5F94|nr:class F sortase [Nocardia yamanashiensis]UGT45523.1 class F sortase [Nocardia yamanashiensis]